MNVASRHADGSFAAKGTTIHIRSMYTIGATIENKQTAIEQEMELWGRKLTHSNLVDYLSTIQVSEGNLRLLSISSAVDLEMRLDKLYLLEKQLPVTTVGELLDQAISGLSHLHNNGLVVGTLYPGRFTLDSTGVLRIADFLFPVFIPFVDKCVGAERQHQRFIAPEIPQTVNSTWGVGGEAADTWSTGVVFMELLCAPHCPWRPTGINSFNELVINSAKASTVGEFSTYCSSFRGGSGNGHEGDQLSIVPASFHECFEKLRRRHGAELLLGKLCRMTRLIPENRATAVCLDEELKGEIVVPTQRESLNLRCESLDHTLNQIRKTKKGCHPDLTPSLRESIITRSQTKAEDVLLSAFRKAETDLGKVISCLETARLNMDNSKKESRGKIVSRLLNDTKRPTATNLAFYTKMSHTAEETTLSLLKDRGMFTFTPKPVVPLLFRSPTLVSPQLGVRSTQPVWKGPVACSVAGSWFLSVTHTKNPPPLDIIEEIGGYSTFSVKTSLGGKGGREITTMKDTLVAPTGGFSTISNELSVTEAVRLKLSKYPSSRSDIIHYCQVNGIPPTLRGDVWNAALGLPVYDEIKKVFKNLNTSDITIDDEQIAKDVPRCHQYNHVLSSCSGRKQLTDVLKGWVIEQNRDLDTPVSHYIQGMASCAAPFVVLSDDPAVAYMGFSRLLNAVPYLACDPATGYSMLRPKLYSLLAHHDSLLWAKLQHLEMPDDIYLSKLRTHFAHDLPIDKIFIIWDALMLGPSNLIFALAVSLLIRNRSCLFECSDVTEASLKWKNSLLEVNVHDWISAAKTLCANTSPKLTQPPYINCGFLSNMRTLPCSWLSGLPNDLNNVFVIDTSWRGVHAGNAHLQVPLHAAPSEELLEKVEQTLGSFGLSKEEEDDDDGDDHKSIIIVGDGYHIESKTDFDGLVLPYFGIKDLATSLSLRGWPNVSATLSQHVVLPARRRPVYVTENCLPALLSPEVWKMLLNYVPLQDLVALSDVCRGVKAIVSDHQMPQTSE
eukprot:TRINITY_DN2956_c0_g1_i1.p1 TRINITY_DN2956_c0_g1~~TRINITY_DN2956_c0_g1_i1.p1  ORF type:complete len:1024 (+),score=153.00 TRINITY_DN2956_c0_g1_i1:52-3072(+)